MRKSKLYLMLVLLLGIVVDAHGKSYYNSISNEFGGLYPHPGMRMQGRYKAIEGDRLVDENATMATAMGLDTIHVTSTAYRYQLRLANTNNKQGKTRSIKNPMTGEKTTLTSTEWGLVLTKTLATAEVTRGVSLEDDLNTICVDVDGRSVSVSIGKKELEKVIEAEVMRPTGAVRVGYLVGPGASVSIERAVLTIDNEKQVAATTTSWTTEALDEHFDQSADPVEGYWKYLDRDMQDDWLRLGGRYTLAVVQADEGYDIIYIDGAQVMKSQWQPGMLKGHFSKTIFSGNYDLKWIDATMEPIDKDAYATIENGVILTLNFPVYKSQVRFAKVIDKKP